MHLLLDDINRKKHKPIMHMKEFKEIIRDVDIQDDDDELRM